MEPSGHREQFENSLEVWREAERAADIEEVRYRSTPPEQGAEAADRLLRAWEAIADARRHLADLHVKAASEAIRLNKELDRRIAAFGPDAREVADFLAEIQEGEPPQNRLGHD